MVDEKNNQEQEVETTTPEEMNVPEEFTQEEHLSHLGPILGVLIVVLVLILGGLYLWGATLSEGPQHMDTAEETAPREIENKEPETPRAEADTQILETVSSSDEIEAIETDIDNTNLDTLDAEMEAIDAELEAALGDLEAI